MVKFSIGTLKHASIVEYFNERTRLRRDSALLTFALIHPI
jgi:hypothetical protein